MQIVVAKLEGDRVQFTTVFDGHELYFVKVAHAVDFLSYYTFSSLAFFHLYFFTVDFLPFRLLGC